jgi:membrane protein YqaA with SNARE-associated domain/VIT1/CCC1 family predicted Fe2+/Mn2+ transporter
MTAAPTTSDGARRKFILQEVQPALLGLMDGSVSTLAPIFAAAGLSGRSSSAFFVGLAASLGAAVSMGLSEALSDDGSVTGRGGPLQRGTITGAATGIGGMLHTLPFLISNMAAALNFAYVVVACELVAIAFIRYRFMGGKLFKTIIQVVIGGAIVFAIGVLLGRIGASWPAGPDGTAINTWGFEGNVISVEYAFSLVEPWIAAYGAIALFVAIYFESFGAPLPSESALIAASASAARGDLSILVVVAVAWSGAVFGDGSGYLIGRLGGKPLLMRFGPRIGLTTERCKRVADEFRRYGSTMLAIDKSVQRVFGQQTPLWIR